MCWRKTDGILCAGSAYQESPWGRLQIVQCALRKQLMPCIHNWWLAALACFRHGPTWNDPAQNKGIFLKISKWIGPAGLEVNDIGPGLNKYSLQIWIGGYLVEHYKSKPENKMAWKRPWICYSIYRETVCDCKSYIYYSVTWTTGDHPNANPRQLWN